MALIILPSEQENGQLAIDAMLVWRVTCVRGGRAPSCQIECRPAHPGGAETRVTVRSALAPLVARINAARAGASVPIDAEEELE